MYRYLLSLSCCIFNSPFSPIKLPLASLSSPPLNVKLMMFFSFSNTVNVVCFDLITSWLAFLAANNLASSSFY